MLKYIQDPSNPESRRAWLLHVFSYYAYGRKDKQEYQIWQHDNHPIELYTEKVIFQKLDYLHQNPVRAGFVANPADWLYSSADYYEHGKGIMPVTTLRSIHDIPN